MSSTQPLRAALLSVLLLTLVTGGVFPVVVVALASVLFPVKAAGSLIQKGSVIIGSELIGQEFRDDRYFHPRPSAAGKGYDATSSGGSNLGPLNPALTEGESGITQLAARYRRENQVGTTVSLPADAVTSSGSGLDPHISPANAFLQLKRVARVRSMDPVEVQGLVTRYTEGRQLLFLGEPRVNVLKLNLALDSATSFRGSPASGSPTGSAAARAPLLLQYLLFLICVGLLVKPLGTYIARVFAGERTFPDRLLRPIENRIFRILALDPHQEMAWSEYSTAFLLFSLFGTLLLYGILRLQRLSPGLDHARLTTPLTPDLALNTALSFATTSTWQAYAGETTMTYFSQMVGLVAQNFLAGAAGLAVGVAFLRGITREKSEGLGNFWADLVRSILWILLPISFLGALALVWQGVPANFHPYTRVHTLDAGVQVIAQGPVAPLEIIKNLGTNGGGFFNANGAHPFENPTPLSNFLELLAIAVIPAALTHTFGRMLGRPRHGWVLFGVMVFLFLLGLVVCHAAEQRGNPRVAHAGGVDFRATHGQPGGNMEGKEVRFGIGASVLATVATSNGATGSYNSMIDSYTPLGGLTPLTNMLVGEVVFGGLGTGLYSILFTAFLGLFVAGLMVGKTPEYAGKVITAEEMKLVMLYTLAAPATILILTAVAVATGGGLAGLTSNTGAHGFSEILCAYTSAFANNGLSFAGLSANSRFYNLTTALAMFAGRFGLAVAALALAGRFARQGRRPATAGTLPTDSISFGVIVVGAALFLSALSYFPALALGPIVEQLLLFARS